jgi:hypothetical protein
MFGAEEVAPAAETANAVDANNKLIPGRAFIDLRKREPMLRLVASVVIASTRIHIVAALVR